MIEIMWGDAHDIHWDKECVYQPKSSCGHVKFKKIYLFPGHGPWEDLDTTTPFPEMITCLQEWEGLTLPTWNMDLPSRDLDARQVKRRGERSRSGWHEIRGTVIGVVVGVRILRTLDFIN